MGAAHDPSSPDVRVGVLAVDLDEGDRLELSVFYRYADGLVTISVAADETCAGVLCSAARATLVVRDELAPHVCLHVEGPVATEWTPGSVLLATLRPERWVTIT